MIKEFNTTKGRFIAVKVPDDLTETCVERRGISIRFSFYNGKWDWFWLPEGNWQLIGLSSEINEDQAKDIVPGLSVITEGVIYQNFLKSEFEKVYQFASAIESFNSLMQSIGCFGNDKWLILKNV